MENDKKSLLELCLNEQWDVIENRMNEMIHEWDFKETDDIGNTPLLICCKKGSLSTLKAFHSILPKFNVHETNSKGTTMILIGCMSGNIELIEWLLESGSVWMKEIMMDILVFYVLHLQVK